MSAVADGGEARERLADLGEGRVVLMDEQGVDMQVLSLTTPGFRNLEPGPAVDAARRVNDLIADARWIDAYKTARPHASLGNAIPAAFAAELECSGRG